MASPRALAYLAYRALVAHPLKRLRARGSGLDRFAAAYFPEGLVPTLEDDRAAGEAAAACISCGLCEPACALAGAAPAVRALGLHAAFRLYGRNAAELGLAAGALDACARCAGAGASPGGPAAPCDAACPTGVPISRIVKHLRARSAAAAGAAPEGRTPAGGALLVSSPR